MNDKDGKEIPVIIRPGVYEKHLLGLAHLLGFHSPAAVLLERRINELAPWHVGVFYDGKRMEVLYTQWGPHSTWWESEGGRRFDRNQELIVDDLLRDQVLVEARNLCAEIGELAPVELVIRTHVEAAASQG